MTRRVRNTMVLMLALAAIVMALVPATQALAATGPTCTVPVNYHSHGVPGLSNGSVLCFMGNGAQSRAVLTLQTALNKCYLAPNHKTLLVRDSRFGDLTEAALRFAQGKADDGRRHLRTAHP